MIVTMGEAMMVFNGPADRPLGVGSSADVTFAGAESNVAIGLARLGHEVRYLSVFGADLFGREIVTRLRGEGVDVSGVQFSSERPTAVMVKSRRAEEEPEVFYYRSTSAFAAAGPRTFDPRLWRGADVVYLTGITPGLSASCLALFRHVIADARAHGIPVWLDPNYRSKLWGREAFREAIVGALPDVEVILPGYSEAELLTGKGELREIVNALREAGVKDVIVKAPEFAAAFTRRGESCLQSWDVGRVVDPIGAGDAFAAGYLSGEMEGLITAGSLHRAHALAAKVVTTRGDWEGLPTLGELERFVDGPGEAGR